MSPLFRDVLSRATLRKLVKGPATLDYSKALGNVTSLFGSLTTPSSSEVQIPLPANEKPRLKANESGVTDEEIEAAIETLYDYLNENLQVLNSTLNDAARENVMAKIWKEILLIIEGLLVPALGDAPSGLKPLNDRELDIVYKWLRVSASSLSISPLIAFAVTLKFLPRGWRGYKHGNTSECQIPRNNVSATLL